MARYALVCFAPTRFPTTTLSPAIEPIRFIPAKRPFGIFPDLSWLGPSLAYGRRRAARLMGETNVRLGSFASTLACSQYVRSKGNLGSADSDFDG